MGPPFWSSRKVGGALHSSVISRPFDLQINAIYLPGGEYRGTLLYCSDISRDIVPLMPCPSCLSLKDHYYLNVCRRTRKQSNTTRDHCVQPSVWKWCHLSSLLSLTRSTCCSFLDGCKGKYDSGSTQITTFTALLIRSSGIRASRCFVNQAGVVRQSSVPLALVGMDVNPDTSNLFWSAISSIVLVSTIDGIAASNSYLRSTLLQSASAALSALNYLVQCFSIVLSSTALLI